MKTTECPSCQFDIYYSSQPSTQTCINPECRIGVIICRDETRPLEPRALQLERRMLQTGNVGLDERILGEEEMLILQYIRHARRVFPSDIAYGGRVWWLSETRINEIKDLPFFQNRWDG
jgi:hypothetical protein